ncbi:TPR end-of-group domain-containing protein [Terriglobus sp.]|uniref:TPR end-of-group domain-containing protein n=1 Tax=Terriglobus sp. TaxID=1889013 RepID=UPI003B00703A
MALTKTPNQSAGKAAKKPRTLEGVIAAIPDPKREAVMADYQAAVTLMQQGKFGEAHPAMERLLKQAPPELTDRIRMYLAACVAQSAKGEHHFSNAEEQYDFAISLLNDGQYEEAREHLTEIIAGDPNADYGFYGLAVLASMTGDAESCLDKLGQAIRLKAQNRFQARADSDFQGMSDDPRFTELLYPDA